MEVKAELKALIDFDDFLGNEIDYLKNEHVKRKKDDVFYCEENRAKLLTEKGFAEYVKEIVKTNKKIAEAVVREPIEIKEKEGKKTRKKKENK